jgi:general secretion pathway protein G
MDKSNYAFTLMELLVVVTIIGLLSATGLVSYTSLSKSSRDARRKSDVAEIRTALEIYRSDNGYYPTGLVFPLPANCTTISLSAGEVTYIQKTPIDPLCKSSELRYYTYIPLPAGCDNSTVNCTSYTIGALLESSNVNSGCGNCSGANICNYCLNSYGELP